MESDRANDMPPPMWRVWKVGGLSLLSAIGLTLIWPPFELWWLAFVALVPLAIAARTVGAAERDAWPAGGKPRVRDHLCFALAIGVPQFLPWSFVHAWMIQLTPPGMVLLNGYCVLYTLLAAFLLRRLARGGRSWGWPAVLVLPIVWTGSEFLRTLVVLGGYPWYPLGLALAGPDTSSGWCALSASLVGVHGLSTIAAVANGAAVDAWRSWRGERSARFGWGSAAAAAVVLLAHIAFGLWTLARTEPGPSTTVLVVQTDLSVSNKNAWSREDQERDVVRYMQATERGLRDAIAAGHRVDLVAWPETMVPGFGLEVETIDMLVKGGYYPGSAYADAFAALHERLATPLVVGAPVYLGLRPDEALQRWQWDRHHNSAYLIDGPPPYRRYDKLVLTPMGEEMPLISRWQWLEEQLLALGAPGMTFDLEAGDGPVRFEVPWRSADAAGRTLRFVTPICFEDTVGPLCRQLGYQDGQRVADLMVNLSNDGWFGWSLAGRRHHVLHARMRAIELAMPMIRSANTGDSVAIEWNGQITDRIGPVERDGEPVPAIGTGTLVRPLTVRTLNGATLYGRIGELWAWTMLAALAAMVWIGRRPPASEATRATAGP